MSSPQLVNAQPLLAPTVGQVSRPPQKPVPKIPSNYANGMPTRPVPPPPDKVPGMLPFCPDPPGNFDKKSLYTLPTGTKPVNGHYSFGNMKVPESMLQQYQQAAEHLCKFPENVSVLHAIQTHPTSISLKTPRYSGDNVYNPTQNIVRWDPNSMIVNKPGQGFSPSTLLGHELNHAAFGLLQPDMQKQLAAEKDKHYDNFEERRVISGWENRYCAFTKEAIRLDHDGMGVLPSKSLTSPEPKFDIVRSGMKMPMPSSFAQQGSITMAGDKFVQNVGRKQTVEYDKRTMEVLLGPEQSKALKEAATKNQKVDIKFNNGALSFSNLSLEQSMEKTKSKSMVRGGR